MAGVEKLYGVIHGVGLEIAGAAIPENLVAPTLVGPSKALMEDILTLPPGATVGIESCPELQGPLEFQGQTIDFDSGGKFYWNRIRRLCQRRGLNVEYLEDFETYKRYLEKSLQAQALDRALAREFRRGNGSEIDQILQDRYKAQVEAEHIHAFDREDKFLERLREVQPAIVVLGRWHADPLRQDPRILRDRGIAVGEYRTERVYRPHWSWSVPEKRYERASLDYDFQPNNEVMLDRELIQRRYRAVTRGRVMGSRRKPDFIGTWDTQIPARGLFEVYLDKDGWHGRVEDCLGTASFDGRITRDGEWFGFLKKYIPDKSSRNAVTTAVMYKGGFVGDEAVGQYESNGVVGGNFRVREFNGTPYQVSF